MRLIGNKKFSLKKNPDQSLVLQVHGITCVPENLTLLCFSDRFLCLCYCSYQSGRPLSGSCSFSLSLSPYLMIMINSRRYGVPHLSNLSLAFIKFLPPAARRTAPRRATLRPPTPSSRLLGQLNITCKDVVMNDMTS